MAKDKFEEFIAYNKDAFDDKMPSDKVWDGISNNLPRQRPQVWWKVAAVIFFCTTAFLAYQDYSGPNVSVSSNELAELESYYFTQIDYKRSLVNNLQLDGGGIAGIEQDLQKLDAMYMLLKEEWKKKPSKQVLEALTLNLLIRLDLLNRHLQDLDDKEEEGSAKNNERSS